MDHHSAGFKLVIFDVDGTLVKAFTLQLLPGVAEFFRLLLDGGCMPPPQLAIATNQGGVGLRYWMETEKSTRRIFYPSEAQVEQRLASLAEKLERGTDWGGKIELYAAYAYRDKKGQWGPVPADSDSQPRWRREWRKPGPGMLLEAMRVAGVGAEHTLMVGDSPDDHDAAQAAGCHFCWATNFFARPWVLCEDLDIIFHS